MLFFGLRLRSGLDFLALPRVTLARCERGDPLPCSCSSSSSLSVFFFFSSTCGSSRCSLERGLFSARIFQMSPTSDRPLTACMLLSSLSQSLPSVLFGVISGWPTFCHVTAANRLDTQVLLKHQLYAYMHSSISSSFLISSAKS